MSKVPAPAHSSVSDCPGFEPGDLRHRLLGRLLALPYAAFARVTADLLSATGYSDVTTAPRGHFRGRNGKGGDGASCGYDIQAVQGAGGVRRKVLVQAKQFDPDRRVFRKNVDELRGVCLREGAAEGLLLTTGALSARLDADALASAPLAPVRLVGGAELLDLLIARHVGAFSEAGDKPGERAWSLDEDYFRRLEAECRGGNGPEDCRIGSELTVTVALEPLYRKPHPARRTARAR